MTDFYSTAEDALEDIEEAIAPPHDKHSSAIDVRIVDNVAEKNKASDYGSDQTYIVLGAADENAVQILPQNLRRKRATITINPGFADNNTTGFVIIGQQGSMSARQGRLLASGNQIVIEHGRALWLIGDGEDHGFTVSVGDELYMSD